MATENSNKTNVSFTTETPFALSFKAEAAAPEGILDRYERNKLENKILSIDIEEIHGESSIDIEVDDKNYYILKDEEAIFNRVYILNSSTGLNGEDIELEGEEKEEFLTQFEKEIEEAELELAEKIADLIEESLKGKFYMRECKIFGKDYPSDYRCIYQSSYDFCICIKEEDLELNEIPTVEAIVVYGLDAINQKIEVDTVLVNQKYKKNNAQKTFAKYVKDNGFEDQTDLDYYEVDIVTDKQTIAELSINKEESFVYEGQKILKWEPDEGYSNEQYIVV